ncbi:uncharacterized protein LOC119549481 [Drosophila subpulchrella]|uniref:uncharacterized protein LOC119549481 n=1 Tax=Drosophila subpulchrella TaxID=1486046 RepID=UPI0018A17E18|nr:uncharacterized protein LOC119549481 [Drosophila subpulchrella]
MSFWWLNGFLLLWIVSVTSRKGDFEVRFESIETIKGRTETLFIYKLRLLGRDRLINGSVEFQVDLDETFEVSLESQAYKNGFWVPGFINVKIRPCEFFKTYYVKYFLVLPTESNLPMTGSEMCPFRKGDYFLKNGQVSTKDWPPIVFQGLNKYRITFLRNGNITGGVQFIIRIIEKETEQ